jgi:hypothetical protein
MRTYSQWRFEEARLEARLVDALRRMGVPMRHSLAHGGMIVICKHQDDTSRDVFRIEDLAKTMAEEP